MHHSGKALIHIKTQAVVHFGAAHNTGVRTLLVSKVLNSIYNAASERKSEMCVSWAVRGNEYSDSYKLAVCFSCVCVCVFAQKHVGVGYKAKSVESCPLLLWKWAAKASPEGELGLQTENTGSRGRGAAWEPAELRPVSWGLELGQRGCAIWGLSAHPNTSRLVSCWEASSI